jgi:hypothetical protein
MLNEDEEGQALPSIEDLTPDAHVELLRDMVI